MPNKNVLLSNTILILFCFVFSGCTMSASNNQINTSFKNENQIIQNGKSITKQNIELSLNQRFELIQDLLDELSGFSIINNNIESTAKFGFIQIAKAQSTSEDTEELIYDIIEQIDEIIEDINESPNQDDLEELSDTQQETIETLIEVKNEIDDNTLEILEDIKDELENSQNEVEETISDLQEDIKEESTLEQLFNDEIIEEDPNNLTKEGRPKRRLNRKKLAAQKIKKARLNLAEVESQMIAQGISQTEIDLFLQDQERRISAIELAAENNNLSAALENGRKVINLSQQAKRSLVYAKRIEEKINNAELSEDDQERIELELAQGNTLEAAKLLRDELQEQRLQERKEATQERRKERKEQRQEIRDLKKQVQAGILSEEEAREQIQNKKEEQKIIRQENKQERKEQIKQRREEIKDSIKKRNQDIPKNEQERRQQVQEFIQEQKEQSQENRQERIEQIQENRQQRQEIFRNNQQQDEDKNN